MLSPQHLYISVGQKAAVIVGLQSMVEVNLVEIRSHEFFPYLMRLLQTNGTCSSKDSDHDCLGCTGVHVVIHGRIFSVSRVRQDHKLGHFV